MIKKAAFLSGKQNRSARSNTWLGGSVSISVIHVPYKLLLSALACLFHQIFETYSGILQCVSGTEIAIDCIFAHYNQLNSFWPFSCHVEFVRMYLRACFIGVTYIIVIL